MAFQKNRMRAQLGGGSQRHRRVHAKFPRFVAGRSDHAPLIAPSSHNYRKAAQFRSREKLDGYKECVHIDVEDGGIGRAVVAVRVGVAVLLSAELSEFRHRCASTESIYADEKYRRRSR